MLTYTDPRLYLFDEKDLHIYVMDDFGTAVRLPRSTWYNPPIWSL